METKITIGNEKEAPKQRCSIKIGNEQIGSIWKADVTFRKYSGGLDILDKTEEQLGRLFDDGDWQDELDNKSEYEYTGGIHR